MYSYNSDVFQNSEDVKSDVRYRRIERFANLVIIHYDASETKSLLKVELCIKKKSAYSGHSFLALTSSLQGKTRHKQQEICQTICRQI